MYAHVRQDLIIGKFLTKHLKVSYNRHAFILGTSIHKALVFMCIVCVCLINHDPGSTSHLLNKPP